MFGAHYFGAGWFGPRWFGRFLQQLLTIVSKAHLKGSKAPPTISGSP